MITELSITEQAISIKVIGIANCDKVKAARKWLEVKQVDYQFCDLRKNPPTTQQWTNWIEHFGVNNLINKRSTSWRQLSEIQKNNLNTETAIPLLKSQVTLMKRPLLCDNDKPVLLGFEKSAYALHFSTKN